MEKQPIQQVENNIDLTKYISKIIYINLDYRTDRRDMFLDECKKMNIPMELVERFSAIHLPTEPGLGCTLSHLNVLDIARQRGYENVLIFEDDFTFIQDELSFKKNIKKFFETNLDWKVLMLAYNNVNVQTKPVMNQEFLGITNNCQTASGYIVNRGKKGKYLDELIRVMDEGANLLNQTKQHWLYMNDQIWKKLQKDDKWFFLTGKRLENKEYHTVIYLDR